MSSVPLPSGEATVGEEGEESTGETGETGGEGRETGGVEVKVLPTVSETTTTVREASVTTEVGDSRRRSGTDGRTGTTVLV